VNSGREGSSLNIGGPFGGKTAFEIIHEEAIIASQSEFKKIVSDQTEALAIHKKEISDLNEQQNEIQ
jgi:hypothetical protein